MADKRRGILFVSKGVGRGHAGPDASIASALRARAPDVPLQFVSYGVGSASLREFGWPTIELPLPETPSLWETVVALTPALSRASATTLLVVSHEEFAVPPIARSFALENVFITDWFYEPATLYMDALRYSREVMVLDDPGFFDVPSFLIERTMYFGPVTRPIQPDAAHRLAVRNAAGMDESTTLVLVYPGGAEMHSEVQAPALEVVLAAFDRLDRRDKRLIWIARAAEQLELAALVGGRPGVSVIGSPSDFVGLLQAADIVITKGNRLTLLEAEAIGLPSLSLSRGHNPIDDVRSCQIATNTALRLRGLDASALVQRMNKALLSRQPATECWKERASNAGSVADRLLCVLAGLS